MLNATSEVLFPRVRGDSPGPDEYALRMLRFPRMPGDRLSYPLIG